MDLKRVYNQHALARFIGSYYVYKNISVSVAVKIPCQRINKDIITVVLFNFIVRSSSRSMSTKKCLEQQLIIATTLSDLFVEIYRASIYNTRLFLIMVVLRPNDRVRSTKEKVYEGYYWILDLFKK